MSQENKFSFQNFKKLFVSFLTDLKNLFPEKSKDIDEWYQSLENEQNERDFIDSVLNPLRKYSREIICNDERMFNMPVQLTSKINLSTMWYTMKNMGVSKEDEKTFWTYLEQLYIVGNIATKPQKEEQFLKVVENIKQKYGNKLPTEEDEDEEDGGFDPESIQKATDQLQKIFGGNPVLNNLVQDIAQNVGEKLKGQNQLLVMSKLMSGDHSMFGDVLSNMSQKYGEQLRNENIDESELQRKTQEVFKGFGGMFPGGAFPGGMFPGMPVPADGSAGAQTGGFPNGGFPNGDDIINQNIPTGDDQNQLMAMQAQMQQMMSKLPANMRKQLESQMSQMTQNMGQQAPPKQQVKAVRSKQKPPTSTPEQNLKFAEDAGFTKYEFDTFEEALGGWNSIVHEHWWKGMREDFLNQPEWNDQAEHAITMMCKDGLGPALETILGNHSEWKRIVQKWEGN